MRTMLMKLLPVILLAGLLSLRPCAAAEDPKETGWVSLFNGKDLAGWVPVHDVTFAVTNGNLRLVTGMGWLRTEKQYTNFVLEAEWRALERQYDSGFFVRAGLEGKPWPNEVWQVNLAWNALGALVKGYKTVVPAETPPMPVNQWVKFRLEVRGRKITLDVNGERAWEFSNLDAPQGFIGIQAENKSFDFRNLRLRELPASAAPVVNADAEVAGDKEARIRAAHTQIAGLRTALDAFEVDNGYYPKGPNGLSDLLKKPPEARNWYGPYADSIPKDPWGSDYIYECPGKHNPNSYDISSPGPPGEQKPIGNWDMSR